VISGVLASVVFVSREMSVESAVNLNVEKCYLFFSYAVVYCLTSRWVNILNGRLISAGNVIEENSSIFFAVLKRLYQLTQVGLYNGRETVVIT